MKKQLWTGFAGLIALAALVFGLNIGAPGLASAAPSFTTFPSVFSSSSVQASTFFRATKQTRIVVTDGSTITPLGTYTPISSTAATGTSAVANGAVPGQLLILHNVGGQTITLTDTGTLHLTGNASMTSDDSTLLIWDGAAWNQVAAESAN
jgi:hypothetical protein